MPSASLNSVVAEYKDLFRTTPGVTEEAYHFIPTTGNPVRVPPRRVPVHYREEVDRQIRTMLEQGIIVESSSPWIAPAVFVPTKSGDLRLCVDYRELNKKTEKDAYPLPLPDEVQDQRCSPPSISRADTGSYQSAQLIRQRLHFAHGQVWGCMSSEECPLDCLEHPVHSRG